jgi:hypothetical protein
MPLLSAEHFVAFLQRFVGYLRTRLAADRVVSDTPTSFLASLQQVSQQPAARTACWPVLCSGPGAHTLCCPARAACPAPPHPAQAVAIEGKTLRFCYDRLASLMKTLEITARWGPRGGQLRPEGTPPPPEGHPAAKLRAACTQHWLPPASWAVSR